jgi:hypothetical protein
VYVLQVGDTVRVKPMKKPDLHVELMKKLGLEAQLKN